MYYWNDLAEVPTDFGPSVVTIGNFDGVHRGHQRVLGELIAAARSRDAAAVAVTFDPHPARVHRPGSAPDLIMGLPDRLDTLSDTGLDATLVMNYTPELASNTPEDFVSRVFVEALGAVAVVIGHDVRWGKDNSGDLATMRRLGAELGFEVLVIDEYGATVADAGPTREADAGAGPSPSVEIDADAAARRCSSTWVREALSGGDVATAADVLGRPHRMRGEVVYGSARGRELGFPTANLAPESTGYIPADGIYAGRLVDDAGTRWPAAISVGSNPTFDGVSRQVEAHVIDRPDESVEAFNLYGRTVVVEFIARLRGMVAYTGPDALVEQMRRDVAQTRRVLGIDTEPAG